MTLHGTYFIEVTGLPLEPDVLQLFFFIFYITTFRMRSSGKRKEVYDLYIRFCHYINVKLDGHEPEVSRSSNVFLYQYFFQSLKSQCNEPVQDIVEWCPQWLPEDWIEDIVVCGEWIHAAHLWKDWLTVDEVVLSYCDWLESVSKMSDKR